MSSMDRPPGAPDRPARVIVVDDEPPLARGLELALRRAGLHASSFSVPAALKHSYIFRG